MCHVVSFRFATNTNATYTSRINPTICTLSNELKAASFLINHNHCEKCNSFFDFLKLNNELGKVIFFSSLSLDLGFIIADFP